MPGKRLKLQVHNINTKTKNCEIFQLSNFHFFIFLCLWSLRFKFSNLTKHQTDGYLSSNFRFSKLLKRLQGKKLYSLCLGWQNLVFSERNLVFFAIQFYFALQKYTIFCFVFDFFFNHRSHGALYYKKIINIIYK